MGKFHAHTDDVVHVARIHALDMAALIFRIAGADQRNIRAYHAASAVDQLCEGLAVVCMDGALQEMQIHVVALCGVHVEHPFMTAVVRHLHGQGDGGEASPDDARPVVHAKGVDAAVVRAASPWRRFPTGAIITRLLKTNSLRPRRMVRGSNIFGYFFTYAGIIYALLYKAWRKISVRHSDAASFRGKNAAFFSNQMRNPASRSGGKPALPL